MNESRTLATIAIIMGILIICGLGYRVMSLAGFFENTLRIEYPVKGKYTIKADDKVVATGEIPATVNLNSGPRYIVTVEDSKATLTSTVFFYQQKQSFPDVEVLKQAANDTHSAADFTNVATVYDQAWGVPQDYPEAIKWYRQAALQGSAAADMRLAYMHENGLGTKQDEFQAYRWYNEAAMRGVAEAEFRVGLVWKDGLPAGHLRPDKNLAINWFKKAAAQGNADAITYLAQMKN